MDVLHPGKWIKQTKENVDFRRKSIEFLKVWKFCVIIAATMIPFRGINRAKSGRLKHITPAPMVRRNTYRIGFKHDTRYDSRKVVLCLLLSVYCSSMKAKNK